MNLFLSQFIEHDLVPILLGIIVGINCALIGSFLVVRRESLLSDSISHSVLPGIVGSFLIFGSRKIEYMILGSLVSGTISASLSYLIYRLGKIEKGASYGIVFSSFFALGVLLLEGFNQNGVDLDIDCVLSGQIDSIFWSIPKTLSLKSILLSFPEELYYVLINLLIILFLIKILYKEILISSFDYQFAKLYNFKPNLISLILVIITTLTVVTSFSSVGSIIVIALTIIPANIAKSFTNNFRYILILSASFATISVLLGYYLALYLIQDIALSIGGMIAFSSFILLLISLLFKNKNVS